MAEKLLTIGFRGDEQYRRRLKQEALNRKTSVQQMLEEAVSGYLGKLPEKHVENISTEHVPKEYKVWVDYLTFILSSGVEPAIEAIKPNLMAFAMLAASRLIDNGHTNPKDLPDHIATLFSGIKSTKTGPQPIEAASGRSRKGSR